MAFAHITTRISGKNHDELLSDVEGDGTPYFCFLDATGKVIARHTGEKTVEAFETTRKTILRWRDLVAKAKAGNKVAAIDAEILACLLGQQDLGDLEEKLEELGEPNDEQKRLIAGLDAEEQVVELMQVLRSARGDAELRESLTEDLLVLFEEDAIPLKEGTRRFFWSTLGQHADQKGNAELLSRCIKELKALPAPSGRRGDRMKSYIEKLEARLKELGK